MNFQPEYNGKNSRSSVSFISSVEKKNSSAADLSLKRSSLQVQVRAPGPIWSPRSVETAPLASAAKMVSERKKRKNWTSMEDNLVQTKMKELGPHKPNWSRLSSQLNEAFGSTRTGKQCRERWLNGLRPGIKKGSWTEEEVIKIRYFHTTFGPRWSTMAELMDNRTDNDIKNKWNSMKKSKAVRERKIASITATKSAVDGIPGVGRHHEKEASTGVHTQSKQAVSNMSIFSAYKPHPSLYSSERAIAPMVTDGGSAENSPVPEKIYWGDRYEI